MSNFRGEPCEVIEQRLARSVKGNRFELLVIRTSQWPRICVLPREVEEVAEGADEALLAREESGFYDRGDGS